MGKSDFMGIVFEEFVDFLLFLVFLVNDVLLDFLLDFLFFFIDIFEVEEERERYLFGIFDGVSFLDFVIIKGSHF